MPSLESQSDENPRLFSIKRLLPIGNYRLFDRGDTNSDVNEEEDVVTYGGGERGGSDRYDKDDETEVRCSGVIGGKRKHRRAIAIPKETNGGVMAVRERGNDNERELAKMKWRKMGKGVK